MDVEAFARQAVGLHARLARAAMTVCGDASIAEDSAAEALLRAWERTRDGEDLRSLEAWTMTVTLNACRSRLRRLGSERRALERSQRGPNTEAGQDHAESPSDGRPSPEVLAAVMALPERQREVVALHYLEDLSTAQIAEITGTTPNAVRNALHHARNALAQQLTNEPSSAGETEVAR